MKLANNLNVGQKITITEDEQERLVLHSAPRAGFETYTKAKTHFETIKSFCGSLGIVLDSNTNLRFDENDYAFKMIFAIKGFEGKIGATVGAEIAAALADAKKEEDPFADVVDKMRKAFGKKDIFGK